MRVGEYVVVSELPPCDWCSLVDVVKHARYDFKSVEGPWGNGCVEHWRMHRRYERLGIGIGQELLTENEFEEYKEKMKEMPNG